VSYPSLFEPMWLSIHLVTRPLDGVYDNTQIYSIPAFDGHHIHHHPDVVARCLEEIQQFQVVRT
jgi:hypothetical protein